MLAIPLPDPGYRTSRPPPFCKASRTTVSTTGGRGRPSSGASCSAARVRALSAASSVRDTLCRFRLIVALGLGSFGLAVVLALVG